MNATQRTDLVDHLLTYEAELDRLKGERKEWLAAWTAENETVSKLRAEVVADLRGSKDGQGSLDLDIRRPPADRVLEIVRRARADGAPITAREAIEQATEEAAEESRRDTELDAAARGVVEGPKRRKRAPRIVHEQNETLGEAVARLKAEATVTPGDTSSASSSDAEHADTIPPTSRSGGDAA